MGLHYFLLISHILQVLTNLPPCKIFTNEIRLLFPKWKEHEVILLPLNHLIYSLSDIFMDCGWHSLAACYNRDVIASTACPPKRSITLSSSSHDLKPYTTITLSRGGCLNDCIYLINILFPRRQQRNVVSSDRECG